MMKFVVDIVDIFAIGHKIIKKLISFLIFSSNSLLLLKLRKRVKKVKGDSYLSPSMYKTPIA